MSCFIWHHGFASWQATVRGSIIMEIVEHTSSRSIVIAFCRFTDDIWIVFIIIFFDDWHLFKAVWYRFIFFILHQLLLHSCNFLHIHNRHANIPGRASSGCIRNWFHTSSHSWLALRYVVERDGKYGERAQDLWSEETGFRRFTMPLWMECLLRSSSLNLNMIHYQHWKPFLHLVRIFCTLWPVWRHPLM